MRSSCALAVATITALSLVASPGRADQLLGLGRIDGANRVVLPGGPTLGLWQGGKFTATPDAIASGGPARLGSGLYPSMAAPVMTTAAGNAGVNTLTVGSTSGLSVGMIGYGGPISAGCETPGAAYQSSFITAISGSLVTMSCPNTSTMTNAQVQFGIQRNDANASVLTNTLMAREGLFGGAAAGASTAWLGRVVTGYDYPATGVLKAVSMPGSPGGLVVAGRTSDATNGAGTFPFFCLYLADKWATTKAGECGYFQSNLMPETANVENHIQVEQSMNTLWPATEVDPFQLNRVNSVTLHRYDCGTGQQTLANKPNTCSTAVDVAYNGATLKNYATVYQGALDTTNGRIAPFAALPPGISIASWFGSAGTRTWDVLSTATGGYGSLDFQQGKAAFSSDISLDAGTSGGRNLIFRRAVNPNFALGQTNDASGDLTLSTFNDSGSFIATAMRVRRGDGKAFLINLNLSGLPSGAGLQPAGLVSGDVWRDTSNGNVLKVAP